jgi:hypothetical protein
MNPLMLMAPMALGAVGGRGGASLLANPAMKLVNKGIDASFAVDAARQVKNLVKPTQKISMELAGLLTTEEATEATDTKPVAPTVTPISTKTNELTSDTRGRHSTQLGSAQIVTESATKRPPKIPPATAIKQSSISLKPIYRAAKDIVEKYAPAAGHIVTYGGAVLTVKALADMMRDMKKKDTVLDLQPTDTVKKSGFWSDTNTTLGKPLSSAVGNYTVQFDNSDTETKTLRI